MSAPIIIDQFEFTDEKPLFRIIVQDADGRQREVLPTNLRQDEDTLQGKTRSLTFSGIGIRITVTLIREEAEVIGSIEVRPTNGVLIREVRFPVITWRPVESFDNLLMSTAWGDNIERPTKAIRERCGGELTYIYPSELAMQYMALHNSARCVYLSRYGLSDESFRLAAKSLKDDELELTVVHYPFVRSGSWQSPECAFAVLPGGWHAAADLYSSHMREKFNPPDVPKWMREDFHGWVQVGLAFEGDKVLYRFADLPKLFRRVQQIGLNTMHIYGWSGHGFDTEYPDYNINPRLGTEDDFRCAMDEIRAMGGHAILYTNGRLVDPASIFYKEKGGDKAICLQENGEPYVERYGTSVEFRIACPACESYREYLAEQIAKIAGDFHAHAIQIDQISCNPGYLCFDKSHPHPTPSTNFLPGVTAELAKIRETHKAIDPDFFTWCEGCHERYGQFYDVNQGHGEEFTWQIGESIPEQFKFNYPHYIVTGISDGIQKLCHTFAQGKPFDFHIKELDEPTFANLVKELVAVRKACPEYFLRGVFRDNVGIETSGKTRAFVIHGENGTLVNLWSPGLAPDQRADASIKIPNADWPPQPVYPSDLSIRPNGSWWEISWTGPVATIITTRTGKDI